MKRCVASKTHAELHSSYQYTSSWFKRMESDPDIASAIAKVMLNSGPLSFVVSILCIMIAILIILYIHNQFLTYTIGIHKTKF